MKYVYTLISRDFPDHHYIGVTKDLKARLASTMRGKSRIPPNMRRGRSKPTLPSPTNRRLLD